MHPSMAMHQLQRDMVSKERNQVYVYAPFSRQYTKVQMHLQAPPQSRFQFQTVWAHCLVTVKFESGCAVLPMARLCIAEYCRVYVTLS